MADKLGRRREGRRLRENYRRIGHARAGRGWQEQARSRARGKAEPPGALVQVRSTMYVPMQGGVQHIVSQATLD